MWSEHDSENEYELTRSACKRYAQRKFRRCIFREV